MVKHFKDKQGVVIAILERAWQQLNPAVQLAIDRINNPLERLTLYCEFLYRRQKELKNQYGYVLGCPWCSLGSEVSTNEQSLDLQIERLRGWEPRMHARARSIFEILCCKHGADLVGLIRSLY